MGKVLSLDDDEAGMTVVTFRGVRMAIDKERILQLLGREQDYLAMLVATGAPVAAASDGQAPAAPRFEFHARQVPQEVVTHASLSMRIKKIHTYSLSSRQLRAAHVGLLKDMIQSFDWVIPDHPNTKLEKQLFEMLDWKGVPPDFRELAMKFLSRYTKARALD